MYTIVVPIPGNLGKAIEPYRQRFDPMADKISANITLLKPFNFALEPGELHAHLERIGDDHPPIKVSLAGWDVYEHKLHWICIPPISGHRELLDLRDDIMTGPLQPLSKQDDAYRPHIIIGRFNQQAAVDQARKDLKGFEPQFVYRAAKIQLLFRESIEDAWQVEATFGLNATAMSMLNR